jgi:hypothetical protein
VQCMHRTPAFKVLQSKREEEMEKYPIMYQEALLGSIHTSSELTSQDPYYETSVIHTHFNDKRI